MARFLYAKVDHNGNVYFGTTDRLDITEKCANDLAETLIDVKEVSPDDSFTICGVRHSEISAGKEKALELWKKQKRLREINSEMERLSAERDELIGE